MIIYIYTNKTKTNCIGIIEADEKDISTKQSDYGTSYTHIRRPNLQMLTIRTDYISIKDEE